MKIVENVTPPESMLNRALERGKYDDIHGLIAKKSTGDCFRVDCDSYDDAKRMQSALKSPSARKRVRPPFTTKVDGSSLYVLILEGKA